MLRTAAGDRAALRILDDAAAAEDVAQGALLRAWYRAHSYDPAQAGISTWLHHVAANAAIDRVRAARPSTDVPVADGLQRAGCR